MAKMAYLLCMDIVKISSTDALAAEDLVTIAVNPVELQGDSARDVYVSQRASGSDAGEVVGGDAQPVIDVQPKYFGKSVVGIRCACLLTDLSWMRSNMSAYEFFGYATDATRGTTYFVSGVMNITADESYDPFNSAQSAGTPPTDFALFAGIDGEMFEG